MENSASNLQLLEAEVAVSVVFVVAPKMTPFSFGDEPLQEGESAGVTCIVSAGDQPLELSWWLNQEKLDPNRSDVSIISGKRSTTLTIDSVTGNLAGNYTCMAKNAAGRAEVTAQLVVNGSS